MNQKGQYRSYEKPSWAPPSWLFGPVWTVLYIGIAFSYGFVLYSAFTSVTSWILVLPFALNLFFNLIFTPIQFGMKSNLLAMFDIFAVLGTLVWALVVAYPVFPWVAYINIPYLAWVCFATVLQCTITYLNRGKEVGML